MGLDFLFFNLYFSKTVAIISTSKRLQVADKLSQHGEIANEKNQV
jgi:hypothetical protein